MSALKSLATLSIGFALIQASANLLLGATPEELAARQAAIKAEIDELQSQLDEATAQALAYQQSRPQASAAQAAAQEAAAESDQQSLFDADFAPWLQQDASSIYIEQGYSSQSMDSGGPAFFTADEKEAIRESALSSLAATNASAQSATYAYATNYAASNGI